MLGEVLGAFFGPYLKCAACAVHIRLHSASLFVHVPGNKSVSACACV